MRRFDLIVLGAGPAGMAAAVAAAEQGLGVCLLDEQMHPGGQIYRDVDRVDPRRAEILGREYTQGARLTRALDRAGITRIAGAVAWSVEPGFVLAYTSEGRATEVAAPQLLIATGALERPMPLPGWTLPGVMTAGAAQILLKQSGLVPGQAVLGGTGPLMYLLAVQMIRAGRPPLALVETRRRSDMLRAARHLPRALRAWRGLVKGLSMLEEIRRARVPHHVGASNLRILGEDHAEVLVFDVGGRTRRIACATVLLHHGVVPNTQVARALEVPHRWNAAQQCFHPVTDRFGGVGGGLWIAGDGAGIGGAEVAETSGRLAALAIAAEAGRLATGDRDRLSAPLLARRARALAIRPFLDAAYPPCSDPIADDTIVCRCEEVRAGTIRGFARQGCQGPNQAKALGRAGMGPCQGRYCGLTVTRLLAEANGASPDRTGYYRIRPPLKPVTLAELAAMDQAGAMKPEGETHD